VLDQVVDRAARAGLTWEATIARADHAVCLAHCGRLLDAHRIGALTESELEPGYSDYARAVVHDSLAELAGLIGLADRQARHAELAAQAWAADAAYCQALREALLAQGPLTD
jgi:hypothetical protein